MLSDYHTCFAIQNKKEYLEIHSRVPQSSSDNIQKIKHQQFFSEALSEQVKKDSSNSSYTFKDVIDWQKKLELFIGINEHFPSVDGLAALYLINNLNDYHPMMHYTSSTQDLLDYWGYNNPDFCTQLQFNGKLRFNSKQIKNILPIKPHSEFKTLRIFNSFEGFDSFIDLKYRSLSTSQIIETILSLPEFWRNFHLTTRKTKNKFSINPTQKINRILSNFYNPSKDFTSSPKPVLQKKQILKDITSNNYFPIYANTFANHLIFRQPGLILPMTRNEQIHSGFQKPNLVIELFKHPNHNYETHSILTHVPSIMFQNVFDKFSTNFQQREILFTKHFEVSDYIGGQYYANNQSQIIFNYESNMVQLFESLSKLDQI